MLRVALACLLCLCLANVSNAKPAPKPAPTVAAPDASRCLGYTAALLGKIRDMIAADPSYEIRIYTDDRAAKVLAAFNSQDPKTDYKADRIMVLSNSEHGEAVMVLLLLKGCLAQAGNAPSAQWHQVIESAIGSDS